MSIDNEKLSILLKEYTNKVGEGLIAAVVVDKDGLVIASETRGENINEEIIGGASSIITPVLKRLTDEFSSMDFGTVTFDTEKFRLIFSQVAEHAILVSILNPRTLIDRVLPYAYLTSEKIARIFGAREVSPAIPDLYKEEKPKFLENNNKISTVSQDQEELAINDIESEAEIKDNQRFLEVSDIDTKRIKEENELDEKEREMELKEIPLNDVEYWDTGITSKIPNIEAKTPIGDLVNIGKKIDLYFVSTIGPGEKKQKMSIDTGTQINELKKTLGNLYGLNPSNFHLSSGGITFDEDKSLMEYNIEDNDEILLIPSSTAGSSFNFAR